MIRRFKKSVPEVAYPAKPQQFREALPASAWNVDSAVARLDAYDEGPRISSPNWDRDDDL